VPALRLQTRTDGAAAECPQSPHTPYAARSFAFCGRASMKHQIITTDLLITTDLRTDLVVTTIAVGAVAACSVIAFMFTFVIAPF
jgi:hypothetical protein